MLSTSCLLDAYDEEITELLLQVTSQEKTDVLPCDCRPANAAFEVFTDDEFQVGRSFPPIQHPGSTVETAPFWRSLGSQKEVKKENTQQPAKWTEGKVCILLLCSMQVHNTYC
jgi:hypothetical protein